MWFLKDFLKNFFVNPSMLQFVLKTQIIQHTLPFKERLVFSVEIFWLNGSKKLSYKFWMTTDDCFIVKRLAIFLNAIFETRRICYDTISRGW